jgi:hypothetical protein
VIDVVETTTTLVHAFPPIVTVAPATNPVPVIVTVLLPAVEPCFSEIAVTVNEAATAA